MSRSWLRCSVLLFALAACGDDDNGDADDDAGPGDAGASGDAGHDGGRDAGKDAGRDAGDGGTPANDGGGSPVSDGGGMDAASDSGLPDTGAPSDSGNLDAASNDAGDLDATTSDAADGDASGSDASADDGGSGDATMSDGSTADASADGGPTETFDAIYADIIDVKCKGCHQAGHPSGLDMSSKDLAYDNLVGVDAGQGGSGSQCVGRGKRVLPGDADVSLLVIKVEPSPPCGSRMPPPGDGRSFLSSDEIARIRRWIDQGAIPPSS